MPTNIFTKFDKDWMKLFDLRERKPYFLTILDNSRAIIQERLGDLAVYRTWLRYYAHQHIHQV